MISKKIKLLIVFPVYFLLLGCFTEGGKVEFGSLVDYKNTTLTVLGTGVANGSSFLYVEIFSVNSNGSVNANWQPELSIVSGSGAVVHNCTLTNATGISRCAITSTLPGIKTLRIDNIFTTTVEGGASFSVPVISKTVVSSVPGSNLVNTETASGHIVSASLSTVQAPLKYLDATSGHIIYSTVQGIVLSDDFN